MRILAARATELEREFSCGVVRQLADPLLRGATGEFRRRLPYLDSRAALLFLRGELRGCLEATLDCARRFEAFGRCESGVHAVAITRRPLPCRDR